MIEPFTGRIIDAEIFKDGTSIGEHPAVIISSADAIALGKILIVPISGSFRETPPKYRVHLRFSRIGGCRTGLTKECAALAELWMFINQKHIKAHRGSANREEVEEVRNCLKRYLADNKPSTRN